MSTETNNIPELMDPEYSPQDSPPGNDSMEGKVILETWIQPACYAPKASNDKCTICHNSLNEKCATCISGSSNILDEECKITLGGCGHAFHAHCINRWTSDVKLCPIDKSPWVVKVPDTSVSDWTRLVVQKKRSVATNST